MRGDTSTIIFISLLLFCGIVSASYETSEKMDTTAISKIQSHHRAYFNCEQSEQEELLCPPSQTQISAYSTSGISEEIYSTFTDKADFVEGQHDTALHFNAYLGEYLSFTKDDSFRSNRFTISFWIKEEPWFESYAPILSFINLESNAGWIFDLQDKAQKVRFGLGTMDGTIAAPSSVPIDSSNFTHITGTFDGSTAKVYKDGVLYGTVKLPGTYNPDPKISLRVGLDSFDNENSWAGIIDDLRIYNRTMSEKEIRRIYDNSANVSTGLVGYWPFNQSLKDVSGNNNDAHLNIQTVSMAFSPDGRMFFSEKRTGEVRVMINDKVLDRPFAKLSDLHLGDHEGLLGITLDPKFDSNHYVYVYSTHKGSQEGDPFNRVVRFTDESNTGTNMTVIMDKIPADPGGYYAGGALTFGPDDKLYVSVGIGVHPENSQNISSMVGKVLRINRDGTIPSDNPFPGSPVYTIGNKNPYGIAFDKNGNGILTENGDLHFDEINIIERGGNYGFPNLQFQNLSTISSLSDLIPPLRAYYNAIAPTQAIFYVGNKYPELAGRFVFGSYSGTPLNAILIGGNATERTINELDIDVFPTSPHDNIAAVAQSPNGDIYFGGFNIYKLKSIGFDRERSVFPIRATFSPGVDITEMRVFPGERSIAFNFSNMGVAIKDAGNSFLNIEIPRNLLSGIYSVSSNQSGPITTSQRTTHGSSLDYNIGSAVDPQYTLISIKLSKQQPEMKILIQGTRVTSHVMEVQ
jgi:glucose/arabinose dehydrogenase